LTRKLSVSLCVFKAASWRYFSKQSSQLVFMLIHTGKEALLSNMKLTSISKINIDATAASLPVSLRFICVDLIDSINTKIINYNSVFQCIYSNMILENERIQCISKQLEKLSLCSRISSLTRMSTTVWVNMIFLGFNFVLFNDKDRSDSEAVKSILTDLNFDFMYDDSLTSAQNLSLIQEFLPMFISYFRFLLGTEVIRT
jgi:hypothetical protein